MTTPATTTESPSIREAIEDSFDHSVETSTTDGQEATTEAPNTDSDGYVAPTENNSSEAQETPEEKAQREYLRDQKGKFATQEAAEKAAKEAAAAAKAQQGGQDGIKGAPKAGQPKDPLEKAPQAWKPEAREFWKDIPPAARAEIIRHEQGIQQALRDTAEDRHLARAFKDTVAPFAHMIKMEGGDPLRAVDQLLTTAARLRTGSARDVAGAIASIINTYGVSAHGNEFIRHLDETLAGAIPEPQDPRIAQVEQRMYQQFAPALQMANQFQQLQQQQMQQLDAQAKSAVEEFIANSEFGQDVRVKMASIFQRNAAEGKETSLEEAYEEACWSSPAIRSILQQREVAQRQQQQSQRAQQARSAGVSVGGSPAFNADPPPPNSIREALLQSMSSN